MVFIVTLVNAFLQRFIEPSSFVYLYLIATITSALLYGIGPSIFASFLSILVADYFFILPPVTIFRWMTPGKSSTFWFFFLPQSLSDNWSKSSKNKILCFNYVWNEWRWLRRWVKIFAASTIGAISRRTGEFSDETMNTIALLRTTILNDISTLTIKYVQKGYWCALLCFFQGNKERFTNMGEKQSGGGHKCQWHGRSQMDFHPRKKFPAPEQRRCPAYLISFSR